MGVYMGEKIYPLDILKILREQTDESHTMKQDDILQALKKQYGKPDGERVSRQTVKNNVEKLSRYFEHFKKEKIGYKTISRKSSREKGEEDDVNVDFHYIHDFTHAELRLIIDSILFSKQIPSDEKEVLIEKLEEQSSSYFKSSLGHVQTASTKGLENLDLFDNIETLNQAIREGKKVTFNYNRYNVDGKSKLTLSPQLDRYGNTREYVINPYQMAASNGRYYLICSFGDYDNLSHYRVDRITNIKITGERRRPIEEVTADKSQLNLKQHMQEHIYMFSGESISARLRFKKYLINEFIDWFGTENLFFSNQTEDEITVRVQVNRTALQKWALQYALHVRVISPVDLVDDIKKDLQTAWDNYHDGE